MSTISRTIGLIAALLCVPATASAQLRANFLAEMLDYNQLRQDCDLCTIGCSAPECELYFRLAIFYGTSLQESVLSYKASCGTTNHTRGLWDFPDTLLSSELPDMATGATVFFGLFDGDPSPGDDDLLGTHTASHTDTASVTITNNDQIPSGYTPDSCGGDSVADSSRSNMFDLSYGVWFTDDTAPTAPGRPTHSDNANAGYDNDQRLDFSWAAAADSHSGVTSYRVQLRENGVAVVTHTLDNATAIDVCTACTIPYAVVNGNSYQLRVSALNGASVSLSAPSWSAYSAWSSMTTVDLVNPITSITAPATGTWQSQNFMVTIMDSDAHLDRCEVSTNTQPIPSTWRSRACNSPVTVTVGPGMDCRAQGSTTDDVCFVFARSFDAAGSQSATSTREFSVDFSSDSIVALVATETSSPGSPPVPNPYGWTQDSDPYFTWAVDLDGVFAAVARWYYAFDGAPGCTGTYLSASGTVGALASGGLSEGTHQFEVQAFDAAGNCGPAALVAFGVDHSADAMVGLTHANQGAWLSSAPTVTWDPTADSDAPIIGYSWSLAPLGGTCASPVDTLSTVPSGLSEGSNTFYIRAVDAALNCGVPETLSISLDTEPESITSIEATSASGGTTISRGAWQPDHSPLFSWKAQTSTSPIAGYSYTLDSTSSDCTVDIAEAELQASNIADGQHHFRVRAIDASGNCGPESEFVVAVDATPESIASLTVVTQAGGTDIAAGTYQLDDTPYLSWPAPASISPIVGFSYAVDAAPDCVGDTSVPGLQLEPLGLGQHTLAVLAIDEAGNCGPPISFELWVDQDSDADGVLDIHDNCDQVGNPQQHNADGDSLGDLCDDDDDGDGVADLEDNCVLIANDGQLDTDSDLAGDACDLDDDNDGLSDEDEETLGLDPLDVDTDGDSIADGTEVGDPLDPSDTDDDLIVDALDLDSDGDGLLDAVEAGDADPSTDPDDTDADEVPDYLDLDSDDDLVDDEFDNCPLVANFAQGDLDADDLGDACDEVDDRPPADGGPHTDGAPQDGYFGDPMGAMGDAMAGDGNLGDSTGDGDAGDSLGSTRTGDHGPADPGTAGASPEGCSCDGAGGIGVPVWLLLFGILRRRRAAYLQIS